MSLFYFKTPQSEIITLLKKGNNYFRDDIIDSYKIIISSKKFLILEVDVSLRYKFYRDYYGLYIEALFGCILQKGKLTEKAEEELYRFSEFAWEVKEQGLRGYKKVYYVIDTSK